MCALATLIGLSTTEPTTGSYYMVLPTKDTADTPTGGNQTISPETTLLHTTQPLSAAVLAMPAHYLPCTCLLRLTVLTVLTLILAA